MEMINKEIENWGFLLLIQIMNSTRQTNQKYCRRLGISCPWDNVLHLIVTIITQCYTWNQVTIEKWQSYQAMKGLYTKTGLGSLMMVVYVTSLLPLTHIFSNSQYLPAMVYRWWGGHGLYSNIVAIFLSSHNSWFTLRLLTSYDDQSWFWSFHLAGTDDVKSITSAHQFNVTNQQLLLVGSIY